MSQQIYTVLQHKVAEWAFASQTGYENPFTSITLGVRFNYRVAR